ncbi:heavy metal translocating P-type ATPase [Pediococcus argentinicus]|uniref:P-type Cu(+) transporter n=1 Tax=Pediococcus argentinicus TaxID=480391 RepID=A0A0R2N4G0_9LACO|nr:heavy metal translocating P-type ATPase [Pediococcus argentinicus]KRO20744.1 copper transporting atpase [Pediococcus argentinicus]NKZ23170.1 copper-translocating P-type ATPase [Pediococcus argentinicus]GEP20366.1 copper-translocating P-type ATPase [Pediococcus argentinicus]
MDMNHNHEQMNDEMMHGGMMMHMGNLKQLFWISVVITIPVLLMSPMMGMTSPLISFPFSDWLVAILATVLFFYGGKPFFSGASGEFKERKPAMMMLITMGISVAYIYSMYAFISNDILRIMPMKMSFFWELATLIDIMLLGHWIEMNAVSGAGDALEELQKLLPDKANKVLASGKIKEIDLKNVVAGDHLLIKGGEKIPTDGIVINGESSVNESLVTGESKLINKTKGSNVVGGSINEQGTLTIKVTGTGKDGYLAKVVSLVSSAQNSKSQAESFADRVAGWLFYASTIVSIIAFFIWLLVGSFDQAMTVAVTVLIIACPHALGLAIPLVVSRSTSIAARNGLLIKNRDALENGNKIDYVLMDKTGTLTEGDFKVHQINSYDKDYSENNILTIMASLEQNSNHPLAQGIINKAKQLNLSTLEATDLQQIPGQGLKARVNGREYYLVGKRFLNDNEIEFDEEKDRELSQQGNSISYLVSDSVVLGLVAEGDQIKSNAKEAIQQLISLGKIPYMLTGDNKETASLVAQQLGIKQFDAELKPEDKHQIMKQLQQAGHHVMMVGDGVNDAPSLAGADIGVAINSGTDVAIDSADVILVKNDPVDIVTFLKLARNTSRKMVQNLWWGAGYNGIAIPLAAGVLAPIGILLDPMVGAILMSLSTVIVAINAQLLKLK